MRAAVLIAAAFAVFAVLPAHAQTDETEPAAWRISLAPTMGALAFDPHLGDYQWDTSTAFQPGLRAALHHRRLALALRTSWSSAEQQFAAVSEATRVHSTQLDLAFEGRIAEWKRIELWGAGHGGRMFLGYEPDAITVDAGGSPVTVSFDPITEWCWGLGLGFRRDVARQLALGLQLDRTTFHLDTAHRSGDEIVEARESFSNWSLSLSLMGFMDLD